MRSCVRMAVVLSFLVAGVAQAQQILVGQVSGQFDVFFTPSATLPRTVIDTNNPANLAGVLTTATVRFATNVPPCGMTFKIRFFRPAGIGSLTLVAERGPFTASTTGAMSIPLTPSVSVNAGDLIGVTMSGDPNCGLVAAQRRDNQGFYNTSSDYSGGSLASASVFTGSEVSLRASSSDSVFLGVIPAVGTVVGANGSAFRTTFQATNEGDAPVKVTYTYHPSKTPGSASDPSKSVIVAGHGTDSTDFLSAMGVTGLGSIDVSSQTWSPFVAAHVFNDTGNGTNGFIEPMVSVRDALHLGENFLLIIPTDIVNFRMNIGVRSLDSIASVVCTLYDAAGTKIGDNFGKNYPASYFEQVTLQEFLPTGVTVPAAGSLDCQALGEMVIYSSITDNKTNDSAIYIAQRRR